MAKKYFTDESLTALVDEIKTYTDTATSGKADDSHTHDDYMTVMHPAGAGYFSLNRKSGTTAGDCSFAEGYNGTASGHVSHAEGDTTTASGNYSHSEGAKTTASGAWSHAEGYYSTASGSYSHAEGYSTIASAPAQHAQGKYNVEDTDGKYAHIVGNGTANVRANIHTLDWDGNAWFEGNIKVGGTGYSDASELATASYVDSATNNKVPTSRTVNGKALSSNISLTAADVGAASFTPVTVSIETSAWSSNTATVSCSVVTASNTLIVAPAPTSYAAWGNSKIRATAQAAGSITFTCDTVPTAAVSVNIVALG